MSTATGEPILRPLPRVPLRMSGLTVLYDAGCPVCRQARRWAERQRQLVPLRFIPSGSTEAMRRFPRLDVESTRSDVTVVTDHGAVLRDDRAWIAVLWCVAPTRTTAVQLLHGRRRRMFRSVKGATEAIRSIVAGQPEALSPAQTVTWAPPATTTTPPPPPGSTSCAQSTYCHLR